MKIDITLEESLFISKLIEDQKEALQCFLIHVKDYDYNNHPAIRTINGLEKKLDSIEAEQWDEALSKKGKT